MRPIPIRFTRDSWENKIILRRIVFVVIAALISVGIVRSTMVFSHLSRQGQPLAPDAAEVIASPTPDRPSPASPLRPSNVPSVTPTESIYGPSYSAVNSAPPPPVDVHARELSATPLPSAPVIAGNPADSIPLTRDAK